MVSDQSRQQLIMRWQKVGCRNPKNPSKSLKPTHPYCKLLVKKYTLENKIDFTNKPKQSEKLFKQIELIERKIVGYKKRFVGF